MGVDESGDQVGGGGEQQLVAGWGDPEAGGQASLAGAGSAEQDDFPDIGQEPAG
ncbi:hypothetical protein OG876_00275 [Kribbella sp. NBC_00359]